MTSMRKPKPRREPETLRELVLDLDERLEGGDALSDVWLPHEEWTQLVETAEEEVAAVGAARGLLVDGVVPEELKRQAREREKDRIELAGALGAGFDTEWPDLLEIARGYALALDVERDLYVRKVAELGNQVVREQTKKSKRPAGTGPADTGGVTHMGCSTCLSAPFVVRIGEEERPGHYADRDTAAEYSLKVGLTAFEIWEPRKNLRWDVYAKCESCGEVTDGHVTSSCPKAKAGEVPGRLRCPRCLGPCGKTCVRSANSTRYEELRQLDPEHRHQLAIDHPTWFCQDRATGSECVLQEEHVGDCKTFSDLEAEEGEREPEAEHPECPHCGEADGHKPNECAMNVDSDAALAADSGRRLNGAGWKRTAKLARESNGLDACHHCGLGEEDEQAGLEVSRNDAPLPDGVFCRGCRVRLTKNPAEWERHGPPAPTMVEKLEADEKEAAAAKAKKKGRASKKFPKGGDLLEPCTACGLPFGDHAGQKCPKPQRRMKFVDGDAASASQEAPF